MKRNFIAMLAAAAILASCGGDRKPVEQQSAQPVVENTVAEPTVYEHEYIVKVGDVAPDFTLQMTDGSTFTLSEQRGKVVMLQFTASWCGVCRKEMPHIEQRIWQRHKDNPNFILLGIDRDEPLEKVLSFMQTTKVSYPMALDPGADIFALYADRNAGITRNVLIDKNGKIIMLTRLFKEEEFNRLVQTIDQLLSE